MYGPQRLKRYGEVAGESFPCAATIYHPIQNSIKQITNHLTPKGHLGCPTHAKNFLMNSLNPMCSLEEYMTGKENGLAGCGLSMSSPYHADA